MENFNITEHIGEDGNFTDGFASAATEALGDNYKGSKIFEPIKNPADLLSVYADTKTAYGKKLEGVIQKPAANATDQEKAEYSKTLLTELGTPEKPEDYEFIRPEKLPEGMEYDENTEAYFRKIFFDIGVPKSIAGALSAKFNEMQIAAYNESVTKTSQQFIEDVKSLDNDWRGDKAVLNNRQAFKAIMQFGTDDLKKTLKEGNINNTLTDHVKWRALGFSPAQRRVWANIGAAMKSDEAITNEGTPGSSNTDQNTTMSKIYDHPTSKVLIKS